MEREKNEAVEETKRIMQQEHAANLQMELRKLDEQRHEEYRKDEADKQVMCLVFFKFIISSGTTQAFKNRLDQFKPNEFGTVM